MGVSAVVTDSTPPNPSPGPAESLGIPVIPHSPLGRGILHRWCYPDAETFYRWLDERKEFPKTSQPSAGAFIDFFFEKV